MAKLKACLALGLIVTCAACTLTIDQRTFFPNDTREVSDSFVAPPGYAVRDEIFDLGDVGKVHALLLDNPDSSGVVLYSGGNGHYIAEQSERAAALALASGFDVILYDYPDRGGTTVDASIPAMLAAYPLLVERFRQDGWIKDGPLFAYGLSFGGSQAAAIVREKGFDGLIIEGSSPDLLKIGRDFVPGIMKLFVNLELDPKLAEFAYYDYVRDASIPVLLISSEDDEIVRPARMRDFDKRLAADGVDVRSVSVKGPHGSALRQEDGLAAVRDFVRR